NHICFGPSTFAPILVDSVSIWSRYLSNGELDALYNGGNGLDYPFNGGPFTTLFQGNLIGANPTPFMLATDSSLFIGNRSFESDPRTYNLTLTQLYTGTSVSTGYRWGATDF